MLDLSDQRSSLPKNSKKILKKRIYLRKINPKKYKPVLVRRPNTEEMIRIMAQLRAMAVEWNEIILWIYQRTIWNYISRTIFWLILAFCLSFLIEDFLCIVLDLHQNMNMYFLIYEAIRHEYEKHGKLEGENTDYLLFLSKFVLELEKLNEYVKLKQKFYTALCHFNGVLPLIIVLRGFIKPAFLLFKLLILYMFHIGHMILRLSKISKV